MKKDRTKKKNVARTRTASPLTREELDDLLTSVSHEFRTPLNTILTFSDMLMTIDDPPLPDDLKEPLAIIHADGMRLLRIIEKLVLMIDLEQGMALFDNRPVLLRDGFEMALESTGMPELRTALKTRYAKTVRVKADGHKLKNLLREILENALTHGLKDRSIRVEAKAVGRRLILTVANDMPVAHCVNPRKVFGKFVQGNRGELTAKPPGMGIGLTVCKAIVKNLRGTIVCERPAKNRWITTVTLPLAIVGKKR